MRTSLVIVLISVFMTLCPQSGLFAQKKQPTVQQLNEQIAKVEAEIKRNEVLLNKVKKEKTTTQSELKLVRSRISNRQKLVESLNNQLELLDIEIAGKSKSIGELEHQAGLLKKEYADMVYAAYKNDLLNNSLAFVFASEDFNDAAVRVDYMKRYNTMRALKVTELDSLRVTLDAQLKEFSAQREVLDKTRQNRDREIQTLRTEESNYQKSSKKLAADEKKISNVIKQKEKEKRNAEAQLQKMIAAETKKWSSKKLSEEDARRMKELSGRFDQNKGKFPYPVQGGVIIDHYGKHPHPTQKGITIDNKGVNIMGEKSASVRSIYEGTVMRVVFIKGLNNCVMIQHGDYFTVYSNLAAVSVKANDKVSTNQVVGTIPSTDTSDDYFLHFEIWKGTSNLNPESWFYR